MQSNFIIINDATGLESELVKSKLVETALCVEDRSIKDHYDIESFVIDRSGSYSLTTTDRRDETGHILQRKWAVFAWQQTGMEGSAICPTGYFNSPSQAAVEFSRRKRAEKWVSDNSKTFTNNFGDDKTYEDRKESLSVLAGEFSDLVWWDYEIGKFRSTHITPKINNYVQYVAEIWVTP